MKLTMDTKSFVAAVSWATKSFDSKDEKSYVALAVGDDSTAVFTHVNQTSHMSSPVTLNSADLDGEDSVVIAFEGQFLQRLSGVLGNSASDEVVITRAASPAAAVTLKAGGSTFTLPTVRVSQAAEPDFVKVGEVADAEYFDTLTRMAKLCAPSSNDVKTAASSVAIHFQDDSIVLMATDTFVLSDVQVDYTAIDGGLDKLIEKGVASESGVVLLPQSSALTIAPSKQASDQVEIVFDRVNSKFGYRFHDGRLALFSLDASQPIPYQKLKTGVEAKTTNSVTLSLGDLKKAIATVSALAWEETDIQIIVNGAENTIVVADENSNNKVPLTLDAGDYQDEETFVFMRTVINNSIIPIATESVQMNFADGAFPTVFSPVLDNGDRDESVFAMARPSV